MHNAINKHTEHLKENVILIEKEEKRIKDILEAIETLPQEERLAIYIADGTRNSPIGDATNFNGYEIDLLWIDRILEFDKRRTINVLKDENIWTNPDYEKYMLLAKVVLKYDSLEDAKIIVDAYFKFEKS